MPLTTDELNWVTQHMSIYKIPYQEVYDEVLDHILSAIEQAREAGNNQPIDILFPNVVDEHFNGYTGIEEITQVQNKAYRDRINRILWHSLRSVLDWKAILFTAVAILITHFLPAKILVTKILLLSLFILEFTPIIYAYTQTRIIKVGKGKISLVRANLISHSYVPFILITAYLNIPNLIDATNGTKTMHNFILSHPEIAALVISLTLIYGISSIYLCRKELQYYKLSA